MLIFGSQKFRLEEVDSTSNFAAKLIEAGPVVNGTVVLADFQSSGRGQRANQWSSNKGENLICSFIWFPDNLSVTALCALNWWVSLALKTLLSKFGLLASVKWPNDLIVDNAKIGGVLIETTSQGTKIASVVIGIGLNVNQLDFGSLNATSMSAVSNIVYKVDDVLNALCFLLSETLESLQNPDKLRQEYQQSLFRKDLKSQFILKERNVEGCIKDVNPQGSLGVEIDNELKYFDFNEISLVYPSPSLSEKTSH